MIHKTKLFYNLLALSIRKSGNIELAQKKVLFKYLKNSYGTELDKKYQLKSIKTVEEYQNSVPVHHYEDMKELWEREIEGAANITQRKRVPYYGITSGTSGKRKFIPMSHSIIAGYKKLSLYALQSYAKNNFDTFVKKTSSLILKNKFLSITGSSNLGKTPSGIQYGTASGILARTLSPILRLLRIPGNNLILDIEDWDEKVEKIVEEARNKYIISAFAMPSIFMAITKKMKEVYSKKEFDYFVKHFKVLFVAGVNYRIYKDTINTFMGKDIDFMETYAATEGLFGIQSYRAPDCIELCTNYTFFEFIEFGKYLQDDYSSRLLLTQLEKDMEYVILITPGNGAFSYVLGDVIKCEDSSIPLISISGRTSLTINLAGEKTAISTIEQVIEKMSGELGDGPGEFFVTKKMNTVLPHYLWVIEKNESWIQKDKKWLARKLDEYLLEYNEIYSLLLNVSIGPSEVMFINKKQISSWCTTQKMDRGHFKLPRIVLNEETAKEIIDSGN